MSRQRRNIPMSEDNLLAPSADINSKLTLSYLRKHMAVGLENRCYNPYIQYRIKSNSRLTYGFVAFWKLTWTNNNEASRMATEVQV